MDFYETISPLDGAVNGANRDFTVPVMFVLNSTRALVNGLVYGPTDEYFGYVELNSTTVRFAHAPKAGTVLQLFYRVATAEGSPFSGGAVP